MKKLKIGVICLANGSYSIFIDNLINSCERNFLINHNKEYFIISDVEYKNSDVNCVFIKKNRNGWPLDCLLRPRYSYELKNKIKHLDYVYFFNANMVVEGVVDEDILPINEGLVGVQHPGFSGKNNIVFTYDRNEKTNAYIQYGDGEIYYQACFWGGGVNSFLEMSHTIDEWVSKDLENKVEPVWLDESYLNKYFLIHKPKLLPTTYACSEHFNNGEINIKIRQLDKNKYLSGNYKFIK